MTPIKTTPYPIYQWQVGPSIYRAAPESGARLMSWAHDQRDILYWPQDEEVNDTPIAKVRGGNPILFPFSARSFDRGDIGYWRSAQEQRYEMPNHGFTRQGQFAIDSIDETGFIASFVPCEQATANYPFRYQFSVEYRFFETHFDCEFVLRNQDDKAIPWSAGHHFYFAIGVDERSGYKVSLPAQKACTHSSTGSLEAVQAPSASLLSAPDLSDRIHYQLTSSEITCARQGSGKGFAIDYLSPLHPEYALVTWTETADSPFYCVEPWMGPPNSAETGVGLHWVQPKEVGSFRIRVRAMDAAA